MTEVSTKLTLGVSTITLSHTVAFLGGTGGGTGGGITQAQADARYVQKTQVDAPSGVAGLDAQANLKQGIQWDSTNW